MRIIHISDCYYPRVGGVESQLRDLTKAQAADGHDVQVLTVEVGPGGEGGGATEVDHGVTIHRLGMRLPFRAPYSPTAKARAAHLIEDLKPDVVHAHAGIMCPLAFHGAIRALSMEVPVAVTWHSMLDRMRPLITRWRRVTDWPGATVALSAVSQVAADQAAAIFDADVAVVHNGIDLAEWATPGIGIGDHDTPLRCVATMRLVPTKRVTTLLDMVATATRELGPGSITLDLYGDGPDAWRARHLIRRLGLGRVVRLHGETSRRQLREAYPARHVFCAPSTKEAFGIAALEARASGLVVLGRAGTGIEAFLRNGEDSVLANSDEEMTWELIRLAADRDHLARLRHSSWSHLPAFDLHDVYMRTMAEYERAAVATNARSVKVA